MQAREIKSALVVVRSGIEQWADSNPAAKEVTRAMTKLLCRNLLPFHFIDSDAWKEFMRTVSPKYRVVSASHVKDTALPELYATMRSKLQYLLASAPSVNLCAGGWSSSTHVPYITLTVQWLAENFETHNYVLSTKSLKGEHTADNIAAIMRTTLREFEIPISKIGAFVTDNGANYVSAVEKLQSTRVACVCHSLQLCILDALKNDNVSWSIYNKAKALVEVVRRSPALEAQLIAVQQRKIEEIHQGERLKEETDRIKRLKTACDTRWNSFYQLFDRVCLLQDALQKLADADIDYIQLDDNGEVTSASRNLKKTYKKLEDVMLTEEEFNVAVLLRESLTRFYLMSNRAESTFCPLSEIPAFVKRAREELKEVRHLAAFHAQLRGALKRRFYDSYTDATLLAVAVDPRYKSLQCLADPKANDDAKLPTRATQLLQSAVLAEARRQASVEHEVEVESNLVSDAAEPPSAKRRKFPDSQQQYLELMQEQDELLLFGTSQPERGLFTDYDSILTRWETEARCELDEWKQFQFNLPLRIDPIDWWSKNYTRFPLILKVACKVLSIPASAASCERLWSKAGLVLSQRRTTLLPEHVDKTLFVCFNNHVK